MKIRELLEKVGLAKRGEDGKDMEPTELDRQVAALRISVESIAKADLDVEERADILDETLSQFRAAYLGLPDSVLKAKADCGDEEDMADEKSTDEEDDTTNKRDHSQEGDMDIEQVTKMQGEVVELQKRLDEAVAKAAVDSAKVAAFETAERDRQVLAKADAMVATTGIGSEQVATLIKQLDVAGVTALEGILKAHKQAVSDSKIFEELGSASGVKVGDEVTAVAADLRKAEPGLTVEQSIAKAYKQNPHLYDSAISR
jgi:hypothetical protein